MVNLIWRRGRAIMVFEVWWFYEYDSCIFFSYNLWARVFDREKSCRFQNLKSEYIGAGMRCNRLPESNIARNNCL